MFTSEDFKKLNEILKEFFYTKEQTEKKFDKLGQKIDTLTNSIDSLAKSVKKFDGELTVETHKVSELEKWAKPAAQKIGVPINL